MLKFEKLQGTGNDFIIFNGIENKLPNHNELAKKVCSRNFGIGADGMMVVEKSKIADIKMLFYNADGTQAPMCGNGIRCFSKFIYENEIVKDESFTVETLGGIMKPQVIIEDNKIKSVKAIDNNGSKIGQSTNIKITDTMRTATQPRTSSNRCHVNTFSFNVVPAVSLYAA